MAVSTHGKIMSALNDRLMALTFTPALGIAWPNLDYTPTGDNYLRVDYLPNVTRQITLRADEPQQFMGIYQVAVVFARNVGMVDPLDVAGQIVNHFKGLTLWAGNIRITIYTEPSIDPPMVDADMTMVPVSISWNAFEPEV